MHIQTDKFAPFFSWMRNYRPRFLKADLFAGLTVAVVAVPQSMACAIIAGLPVQYGLYASLMPTIIGCLWGSSAHLITGPTTAVSLVVFSVLQPMAPLGSVSYLELTFFLALLVGMVQLVMGITRLGGLLNFVSHSVLLGFTAGAAVLIAFKQMPALLGLNLAKSSVFVKHLLGLVINLRDTELITLGLGVLTMGIILLLKRWRPTWPGTLLAMVVVGLLVALFGLDAHGVAVVGTIPSSLPTFSVPHFVGIEQARQLVPGAVAIAILGLVEAVSIAKSIADQTRQRLNVNREFIGQGLANMSAACFSGYAGSGSFVRSAINYRAGAKTPLSAIFSAAAVAVTLLLAAPLAAKLPHSALAGVLIVVAYDMVHKADIVRAVKSTRADAVVLTFTFAATLLVNIEFAIYIGVLLSIGLHLAVTSHPKIYSVVPEFESNKMVQARFADLCCQMDIVQVEGSIFFGSATVVLEDLQRHLRNHPHSANLLLRMHQVNTLDASGIHLLEIILEELRRRGGSLYLSGVHHRVFEVVKNSGLLQEIGATHLRTTTASAIRQAMRENFCPAVCAVCPFVVFRECPDLKTGNWEIFGPGVKPRICVLPTAAGQTAPPGGRQVSASTPNQGKGDS